MSEREALIRRLHESLPQLADCEDVASQARSVLGYVVAHVPSNPSVMHFAPDPSSCPNCGVAVSSTRSPYCGETCREVAGFVRQFRAGLELGWIFEAEKQVALGQNLWDLLGGGRPLRREIAPARSLRVAHAREGGICQVCGATATTIDHVGSGCNRPINLRAVCETCCQDRSFGDPRVTEQPGFAVLLSDLSSRIGSEVPIRCCDDAATWDWRAFIAGRRLLI